MDDHTDNPDLLRKLLVVENGKAFVDSRDVAERFGKEHYNVLRDVENILRDAPSTALNFEVSSYKDKSGKKNKCFRLTRDGFTLLTMGLTGKEALEWKLRYIKAFNLMEAELREKFDSLRDKSKEERASFTRTLKQHNVKTPREYADVTNGLYDGIWNKTAKELRKAHNIPAKVRSLRDAMSPVGLASVILAEAMASDRIKALDSQGVAECTNDARVCGAFVRVAISDERKSRGQISDPS